MLKYIRGSIWWANLPEISKYSHIQCGRRPVIVVSNNKGNEAGSLVTVIPCTTRRDSLTIIHPKLKIDGEISYALVEQIRTLDQSELFKYMGIVDENSMKEIEKSIMLELGLNQINTDDAIINQLKTITSILQDLEDKKKEQTQAQIDKDVIIKQTIGNLNQKIENIKSQSQPSQIDKFNARLAKTKELQEQTKKPVQEETSRTRRKWSIEDKKALYNDYLQAKGNQESSMEIVEKWELGTIKNLQTYANLFRRQLNL